MKPLDAADMLMERLIFAEHKNMNSPDRRHRFNLWDLDRVDASFFVDAGDDKHFLISEADERRIYVDPAVAWPFHVQTAFPGNPEWPSGSIQVVQTRTCSLAEARKYGAQRFAPRMVFSRIAMFTPSGVEAAFGVSAFIGKRWIDARQGLGAWQNDRRLGEGIPTTTFKRPEKDEDHNPIAIAQSIALTQRYEWAVRVGFDEGPKIRFATDPAGLRAMFRDRDKPADRERRSPLRHWVREHWRKSRVDDQAMSFVIAHLRGREAFRWWGYDCVIEPSQYDLERLELT